MSFKDKYTTEELISKNVLSDDKKGKDEVKEKDKIVISNDAMAIGELLECFINQHGMV